MKARAVFVDLTGAYHGLLCKLLRLLPDRHTIIEMVGDRSFTLTTINGKPSKL